MLRDGSLVTTGEVIVGYQRISAPNINDSVVLSSSAGRITHASVVDVMGQWSMTGDMVLGNTASKGILEIENGGRVSNASGFVQPLITYADPLMGIPLAIPSTVTVAGEGSEWLVNDLLLIDRSDVIVEAGGAVFVGNQTTIAGGLGFYQPQEGTLTLNGGTLQTGSLSIDDGTFNFNAGTLNITEDLVIGSTGPLGFNVSTTAAQTLMVDGTTTVEAGSILTIDGGTFSTGTLAGGGSLEFNTGVFELTQQNLTIGIGGLFGNNLLLDPGQTLNVTNSIVVDAGAVLAPGLSGQLTAGSVVNKGQMLIEGLVSSFSAGAVNNNNLLTGDGRLNATLMNASSGEV